MLRAEGLRLAVFDVDATQPVGSMMAYDPVKAQGELGLRGRGVIVLGAGAPIVLCAVDWIGISNEGHDVFRQRLAQIPQFGEKKKFLVSSRRHNHSF
jgi:hypothetical protein